MSGILKDMEVIKRNGEREAFSDEKVLKSMTRTGVSEEEARAVLERVKEQVHDGVVTTAKLYHLVRNALHEGASKACFACRYDLREAILKLGPAGFQFEAFVVAVLAEMGYKAYSPKKELRGSCVMHEVDVIAEKEGKRHFIEVKFRNEADDFVDLKDVMATWARFLDLCDAEAMGISKEHFDEPWLVTNARFSDRGTQFGQCKGIYLLGWKIPDEENLMTIVDNKRMYPVTVIRDLSEHELAMLARVGWMLCSQVAEQDPDDVARRLEITIDRAETLVEKAGEIVE